MGDTTQDIGIDLGTVNTIIYARGRGIVLSEPSVVAVQARSGTALAVGTEARNTIGRTPDSITAIRPLKGGVISDYGAAEEMIRHFVRKAVGSDIHTRMVLCVPSGITPVEERAIVQAAERAGARTVQLVEEPMAAAMGAGLPVSKAHGSMVVDIGGGTTEVAVISLGGIVAAWSLRVGGDGLDAAIAGHVRKEHGLLIGERTAEAVKLAIGSAWPVPEDPGLENRTFAVGGRETAPGGQPHTLELTAGEIRAALDEAAEAVVTAVKSTLEECPPELADDVMEHGIVLTGGGALLPGLDLRIAAASGIPVFVADDALDCVALGAGKCVENFDALEEFLADY